MLKALAITILLSLLSTNLFASDSANPPVKKSNTGICHPKGGTYYEQTKHFTSFKNMDLCLKSGGRASKK